MRIEFENVSFSYPAVDQSRKTLDSVNLTIDPGEFVALSGPSGCGKTTLIQLMTGLLKPSSGKVKANGIDIWQKGLSLSKLRRKIGLVFQFPEKQLFERNVYSDIAFGPNKMGMAEEEVELLVHDSMNAVGLPLAPYRDRSPFTLSAGEKRRVAIAGVLALEPEILVLDEPTAGLDRAGVDLISETLKRYHSGGRSILLISHDTDVLFDLPERVILMDSGSLKFDGDKQKLVKERNLLESLGLGLPRTHVLARFLNEKGLLDKTEIFSSKVLLDELTVRFDSAPDTH